MTSGGRTRLRFDRWETWAALLACGCCAGVGSFLGQRFGHSGLGAALGGAVGGWLLSQARDVIARRDDP